eukprot:scpid44978/ scgid17564/ 
MRATSNSLPMSSGQRAARMQSSGRRCFLLLFTVWILSRNPAMSQGSPSPQCNGPSLQSVYVAEGSPAGTVVAVLPMPPIDLLSFFPTISDNATGAPTTDLLVNRFDANAKTVVLSTAVRDAESARDLDTEFSLTVKWSGRTSSCVTHFNVRRLAAPSMKKQDGFTPSGAVKILDGTNGDVHLFTFDFQVSRAAAGLSNVTICDSDNSTVTSIMRILRCPYHRCWYVMANFAGLAGAFTDPGRVQLSICAEDDMVRTTANLAPSHYHALHNGQSRTPITVEFEKGHFCQTGNVTCQPNSHCVGKGNSSDCLCNAGFTQVEDKCIVWFGGAEELPGHDNCKANEYFTVPSNYTIATAWADYAYAERACSDFGLVLPSVSVAPRCLHDFVFGLLLPDSSQRHEMVWVQRADGTLLQRSSRGHTYTASRTATAKLVCYTDQHTGTVLSKVCNGKQFFIAADGTKPMSSVYLKSQQQHDLRCPADSVTRTDLNADTCVLEFARKANLLFGIQYPSLATQFAGHSYSLVPGNVGNAISSFHHATVMMCKESAECKPQSEANVYLADDSAKHTILARIRAPVNITPNPNAISMFLNWFYTDGKPTAVGDLELIFSSRASKSSDYVIATQSDQDYWSSASAAAYGKPRVIDVNFGRWTYQPFCKVAVRILRRGVPQLRDPRSRYTAAAQGNSRVRVAVLSFAVTSPATGLSNLSVCGGDNAAVVQRLSVTRVSSSGGGLQFALDADFTGATDWSLVARIDLCMEDNAQNKTAYNRPHLYTALHNARSNTSIHVQFVNDVSCAAGSHQCSVDSQCVVQFHRRFCQCQHGFSGPTCTSWHGNTDQCHGDGYIVALPEHSVYGRNNRTATQAMVACSAYGLALPPS